jgi:hypothetical protein
MKRLALLALGLAATDNAQLPPGYTRAAVEGVATPVLAERLLGQLAARSIERHEVDRPYFTGSALSSIRFYARQRPIGHDICARDVQTVFFETIAASDWNARTPPINDPPTRVERVDRRDEITLAPDCRMIEGQRFAHIQRLNGGQGLAILRALIAARDAARGDGTLPFHLTCVDSLRRGACGDNERAALAALPVHQAFLIERYRGDTDGRVLVGSPGSLYWDVRPTAMGTPNAMVIMSWTMPAPF